MRSGVKYLFIVFWLVPSFCLALNGWESIKANDHKEARKSFLKQLEKDSTDLSALKGLIVLSEMQQDKLSYNKYVNSLINNSPEENYYLLLRESYDGSSEKILNEKKYSEGANIYAKLELAADQKEKREFAQSARLYGSLFNDIEWSFIGPFKNISGSGYTVEYPVEKEKYDSAKTYKNNLKLDLKWVKPLYRSERGKLDFEQYLPESSSGSVCYANGFINVPAKMEVEFRISRTSPLKIWLDDHLVFENNDKIKFQWDNEIVRLTLEPGIHRILIKNATAQKGPKSYGLLDFNGSGDSYSYDYYSLFGNYSLYSDDNVFTLRITTPSGERAGAIQQTNKVDYTSRTYTPVTTSQQVVSYFEEQLAKNKDDIFNYYALCRAYMNAGLSKKAEPFFVKKIKENNSVVLFKYLLALIYAENGKIENVYATLSDIDQDKTPIFGLLFEKLKEIDMDNEEKKFLAAIDKLKEITPSHYSLIKKYFSYYDKKGLQKEKEAYIKDLIKTYPTYEVWLDHELKDFENKPDKVETDKEVNKETKETIKKIKTRFISYDYTTAINYYKAKGNFKKAISLYDELIKYIPYSTVYRKDKANYLYSEEKYDEALNELSIVLKISPYDDRALELMGDIYYDIDKKKGDDQHRALQCYYKIKRMNNSSYGIDSKIEKIEGKKSLKKIFSTKSFEDILADGGWNGKYDSEESLILLYTRDMVYDTASDVEVYQQMAVQIFTEAGAKSWTEYDFSFLGNLNTVKVIKQTGAEITPDKRGGYVVFKNLEPGDVILIDGVYKWHQQTEFDNELALIHYVSFNAPIYYKKFEVAVPAGMYLGYMHHKLADDLVKSTKDGYDYYKWEYNNIPKVEKEEAVLDNYDRYSNIMISTMRDWSKVVDWYDKTTYRKLEMTYEVKEALDSIINPLMNDDGKVEAIYNYLTRKIKYSYVHFLQSGYVPKTPGLTLSSGIGDCKDVATLMIVMLREVGIEADYALVKTNSYNHLNILPSMYFDHVVVYYKTKSKAGYLDMTTDFYPYYVLTENDIGAWSLLIKPEEKNIFQLPEDDLDKKKNEVDYNINVSVNVDNTADVLVSAVYKGIEGGRLREMFSAITESEQKNYIINMLGKGIFSSLQLSEYKFENIKEITQPLIASYKLKAEDFTENVANMIVTRIPYMTAITTNPAISSEVRINRLDLNDVVRVEPTIQNVKINFPKGYKLVQLPADIKVNNKYGSYSVKFKKTDTGIMVQKEQSFTKRIIDETEFDEFKKFYLQLLKLDKTKIALQKV